MSFNRNEDGVIVSQWDPPEIPPQTYAGCLYCNAPVDVSNLVNRAVADALFAVSSALEEGADPKQVIETCDRAGSELYELVRFQDDDSLGEAAFRRLSFETSRKKREETNAPKKKRRKRRARAAS